MNPLMRPVLMEAYDLDQRTTPEVVRISKPSSILKLFWSLQMESREVLCLSVSVHMYVLVSYLVGLDARRAGKWTPGTQKH